jgi:hypothetical protein
MSKNRWSVIRGPCLLYSPDLAITDFDLFVRSKHKFFGSTFDSEQNVLETITEILNELPKM